MFQTKNARKGISTSSKTKFQKQIARSKQKMPARAFRRTFNPALKPDSSSEFQTKNARKGISTERAFGGRVKGNKFQTKNARKGISTLHRIVNKFLGRLLFQTKNARKGISTIIT